MTADIERLIRPHLARVRAFSAIDPPEVLAERVGVPANRIIRLNGNENPYGASPKAAEALTGAPLHIYPDPLQREVRGALGSHLGIDPEHVIAGAGSDELIDLLFRLFTSPGDSIIDCEPTFGMYSFCAKVADTEIRSVQRDELFGIDVQAVMEAIDSTTKIIFVNSPNNPTGNLASEADVKALLDTGLMVAVDEAYHEFCGQTMAGLVYEHDNLVVLRTMSKWAGLAGLRVGYGIMSPGLVRHIIDIKQPYNVSTVAEAALLASLEDAEALMENVRLIVRERERMFSLLKSIPRLKPWPSAGNFILCEMEPGLADIVYEGLTSRGIFVRRFSLERLRNHFRITVGTPEQTDAVIGAITELVQEPVA